ncbi:VOC family protein [Plastoroseomonas arctica]|uniref:VOC family protein n=1 Tax=Plastoroseomonas arctica TaxID=1509237 RepID=UPI003462D29A
MPKFPRGRRASSCASVWPKSWASRRDERARHRRSAARNRPRSLDPLLHAAHGLGARLALRRWVCGNRGGGADGAHQARRGTRSQHQASRRGSHFHLYVSVDDLDAIAARNVAIVEPPHDTPWGMREMIATDDQGHILYFGQQRS